MEFFKSITAFFSNIFLILAVVYGLIFVPTFFQYKPMVVFSNSMEPSFGAGSVIYSKYISEEDIEDGDVIVYKNESDELVAHRVVSHANGEFITKGDANKNNDSKPVKYSDIVGRHANVVLPYFGYFVKFVQENKLLVILGFAIMILDLILHNLPSSKKNKLKFNR